MPGAVYRCVSVTPRSSRVLEGTVTDENAATPVNASFNDLVSEMTT